MGVLEKVLVQFVDRIRLAFKERLWRFGWLR